MSTGFFVPGPAQLAVGLGASRAMAYLGFSREGARVSEEAFFEPVKADYSGQSMPADMTFQGYMITVTFQLSRFDPAVMNALRGRFFTSTAGAITANIIGSLMLQEGGTFPFMIKYPNVGTAQHPTFSGYDTGINIPNAIALGRQDYEVTTREQVWNVTIASLTSVNPATLTGTVFSSNVSGFPAIT